MRYNKTLSIPGALIFLFAIALYANTFNHRYTIDDALVITRNQFTQQGIAGIRDILTHDTFEGFFQHENQSVAGGRYRPLSLVTFALEKEWLGNDPFWSHVINVLLYACCGVLLFFLLHTLLPGHHLLVSSFFIALLASLLFVAHPVHTEAVANVKGRDEIMAMMGSIAALWLAILFLDTKKWVLLAAGTGCFFLALLSKENAITFMAVIPLSIFFFRKASRRDYLVTCLPFLIAVVAFLLLRSKYTSAAVDSPISEVLNNPFVYATFPEKYATIVYTLGKYLFLLFYPFQLTHDYYYNQVPLADWGNYQVIISAGLYLALLIFAFISTGKKHVMAYGIWFYLLTLAIVSNVFFPVGTSMSERFLFMPSLGFCLVMAFWLSKLYAVNNRTKWVATGIAVLMLSSFSLKTFTRNKDWKDNYTIFSKDVKVSVNSAKAHFDLGAECIVQAVNTTDSLQKRQYLSKAIQEFRAATSIYPSYALAWMLSGDVCFLKSQYPEAISYYRKALDLNLNLIGDAGPELAKSCYQLGVEYGRHKNHPDSAIYYLQLAIHYQPGNADAYQDLGVVYALKKDYPASVTMFEKALELNPHNKKLYGNLSLVYRQAGDTLKAREYQLKAEAVLP